MHHTFAIPGTAVLPATLIAIPRGATVVPEATPMVTARAFNDRISWQDAWQRLRRELQVDPALCPEGVNLFDSRLLTQLPKDADVSSVIYHDLREMLGRPVYNPRRDGSLPPGLSRDGIISAMRDRLAPYIAPIAHDDDLLAAAADPAAPMRIGGLAHVQTWWPPREGLSAEAFIARDFGQYADLSAVPEHWLKQLRLPRHQPSDRPISEQTAA